ncbi:MAG: GGDEF domain-containing protein [Sphingomonadales bacterium]|nr:GGDEF domain-containing protein [Sphingomonadales bacterium]
MSTAAGWLAGIGALVVVIAVLGVQIATPGLVHANVAAIALAGASVSLLLQLASAAVGRRELSAQGGLIDDARRALTQTDELFMMTEMLQSADGYEDAMAVLTATSLRLLPGLGGALYIFNNSRDRLDYTGGWRLPDGYEPAATLAPANCWALKRGKRHVNDPVTGTLCCAHHASSLGTLEVPMMARGKVYGLLLFVTEAGDSFRVMLDSRRLAQALADSMSLALSNISLREKLRTQSLRDPLTGLYNRRYMEDALERYVSLAERNASPTAVVMIDLDNFKRLNDSHGHAKGDAVLRDVAAQLVGGLRPSDIVCRYGGEELLVILPDCPLADAVGRAEALRLRIEQLSETHGAEISASFGVAAIPETATTLGELVPMADAALFRAKRDGKNRVNAAESRNAPALRLAVPRRRAAGGG